MCTVYTGIKADHVAKSKPNNCTWNQLLNSSKPNTREDTKDFLLFILAQINVCLALCVYPSSVCENIFKARDTEIGEYM